MHTGKRTCFDASHFLFPHGRQFHPYNFLHVYLRRIDRREFEYRAGNVFGMVDGAANGGGRPNAAGGREGDDNEVHAALPSIRRWFLSRILGDIHRGTHSCKCVVSLEISFDIFKIFIFILQIVIKNQWISLRISNIKIKMIC